MKQAKNIQTVILGIGNILLGDEGIGVHVAKKIEKMNLPSHIKVINGATAGYSLLPIFETYKDSKFLIIDAVKISNEKKGDSRSIKGGIYIIPLSELYNISKLNYPDFEFISFHQTGLMDVLTLLYMTSKIKIEGYLIGINIFNSSSANLFHTFSMKLSTEVEQKIPEIIEILKKHI